MIRTLSSFTVAIVAQTGVALNAMKPETMSVGGDGALRFSYAYDDGNAKIVREQTTVRIDPTAATYVVTNEDKSTDASRWGRVSLATSLQVLAPAIRHAVKSFRF